MADNALAPVTPTSRLRVGGDVLLVCSAMVLDLLIWNFGGHTRLRFTVPAAFVIISAAAVFAVLLVRRRHPWAAFLSMWGYSVLWGALLPTYQPFTGLLIALYRFARHTEARIARQPLPLLVLPWAINTYNAVVASGAKPVAVLVTAAIWFAMAATVWLAGRAGYRTQHIFELQTAKQAAEAALALQNQQLRLARELHDIVAHSISAVMFQAAGARAAATTVDPKVDNALRAIETTSTQATRELRRLLGLLHPEADASAVESGASLGDLDQLVDTTRACGVEVDVSEDGSRTPLDPSVDHTAYRVLQEALANAMKHGGEGSQVTIRLGWKPGSLRIAVRSRPSLGPARSLPTGSGGYGLPGLRQRVLGVGGRLEAGPALDGFLLVAELPLAGPA